ncbi:MAG: hypothetical protein ABI199_05695 [Bacteroidia bacterium]
MKKKLNHILGILFGIGLILFGFIIFFMYHNTQEMANSYSGMAPGFISLLFIMYKYLGRVGTFSFWVIIGGIAIYKKLNFSKKKS